VVEEVGVSGENHGQETGKLYHLSYESSSPFFVIYKAGHGQGLHVASSGVPTSVMVFE
jgi:hypothetical protein